jgi:hypothetical protein
MARTKKIMGAVAAVALVFTTLFTFAFKSVAHKNATLAKRAGFFYQYNGPNYSEEEIRKVANYERSENSCEDGENLCGVILSSDPSGTDQPVTSELNAIADELWASQQNGSSINQDVILMKN